MEYILSVFNPTIGRIKEIAVSEAIYNEYLHGGWAIENNDRRFHKHETVITDLSGNYESFDEFCLDDDNPALLMIDRLERQELQQAMTFLKDSEQELLRAIFLEGKTEREIAASMGVSQNAVNKQKQRIIKFLKKYLI